MTMGAGELKSLSLELSEMFRVPEVFIMYQEGYLFQKSGSDEIFEEINEAEEFFNIVIGCYIIGVVQIDGMEVTLPIITLCEIDGETPLVQTFLHEFAHHVHQYNYPPTKRHHTLNFHRVCFDLKDYMLREHNLDFTNINGYKENGSYKKAFTEYKFMKRQMGES